MEAKLSISHEYQNNRRRSDDLHPSFTAGSVRTARTASNGTRIIAYLIDAFILMLFVPLGWFISVMTLGLLAPVVAMVLFLLPFLYHTLCISSPQGATVGQRMMGVRVIRQDGGPVNPVQALLQTILFYATLSFSGGLLLIWCLFDDQNRCLHDIFSGTLTISSE